MGTHIIRKPRIPGARVCLFAGSAGNIIVKGPFIIYTLGGWEILMSYTKILKPPPLDDLNVEDPPIKY